MNVLGVVLVVVAFLIKVAISWTIGIAAVVLGAMLALPGAAGREIDGHGH